jgi:hypothetical protein
MLRAQKIYLVLGLIALAAYLPGFWWGVPDGASPDRTHSWGVDATMPLGPLAEMHNIIEPKPDRNLGYPLMHSFMVSAAYVPYLGYLWLTGGFRNPSAIYPYGFADPESALGNLTLIAQFLSVILAAGVVVAAYDAGRSLWNRSTGIWAALFVMSGFPMFYYSRTGNPDIPVLFFTSLALAAFARILGYGLTAGRAAAMGAFTGFAVATKEPSAASFLLLPPALLLLHWKGGKKATAGPYRALAVAGIAAFLAFGLGSGLFVDSERYFAHLEFARERGQAVASGQSIMIKPHFFTWAGNIELSKELTGATAAIMTVPGLLLSVAGLGWVAWRERSRLLFALPALSYVGVICLTVRVVQLRYLMPVAFTLAFFAARAVTAGWGARIGLCRAVPVIGCAVLAIGFLRGIDLTYSMVNDSRYAAGAWFDGRTEPGDRVETFGPLPNLPPLKSGVVSAQAIQFFGAMKPPRVDAAAVREIERAWETSPPKFVVLMPDYTSRKGEPHSRSCPPEIYRRLNDGSLGYSQVAFFQSPRLFPWLSRPDLDYPTVNPPIRVYAHLKHASRRL